MLRRTFLAAGAALVGARAMRGAPAAPLKIGQIGTGHAHAAGKMSAMRLFPGLWEVVGLAEPDPARAAAALKAKAYAGLPLLTEEALLAVPGLRAVAVETRMEDSCATALRALRAGKHVHLDKPGALDHGEFKAMRLLAEERRLTVQMGYMLRYNPAFEMLFRVVREGWLGDVMEIDAVMGKLSGATEFASIDALPGGGMFELGCHPIDAIVFLLGKPAGVEAFSTPVRDARAKDNQLAVLRYPKATATVRVNHSDPFGGPRRRFNVTGTGGTLEILPMESGKVTLSLTSARGHYAKGTQAIPLERRHGRYDQEFVDLARVVRGEKALAWTAAHDIAVHETVLRASGAWRG
jgi:predicted dehydrogenase